MKKNERAGAPRADTGRRAFLGGLVTGAMPVAFSSFDQVAAAEPNENENRANPFPGMITRQKNPDNLEFPFPTLNSFLTPNERFYVRNHFDVPAVDARKWRLNVEGAVERPTEIGYDELRRMPARSLTAVLECSGNSRVLLKPPQTGIRWDQGAVSNAEWTGVPLSEILHRA